MLIAQDRALVERFRRGGDLWMFGDLRSLDDVLHLESIDCQIPLSEIYYQIEMESET